MTRTSTFMAASVGLLITAAFSISATAATCPTKLTQDSNGYWLSKAAPGWKSHKATPRGVTLSTKNFGGVVYSPARNRLACVYRASNKKWVAVISNMNKNIKIDKNAVDASGKKAAWKFSTKHKDYACGQPSVQKIETCQFSLGN